MSITPEDIKQVVLSEDDFGHEMRVGNILKRLQLPTLFSEEVRLFNPEHGGTYIDPVTGKPRQFDYRYKIAKADGSQSVHIAIECKNIGADSPVIVCGRPRTDEESFHAFILRTGIGMFEKNIVGVQSRYKPDAFVGKSILRIRKNKNGYEGDSDAEIYDRWSQALASCHGMSTQA